MKEEGDREGKRRQRIKEGDRRQLGGRGRKEETEKREGV